MNATVARLSRHERGSPGPPPGVELHVWQAGIPLVPGQSDPRARALLARRLGCPSGEITLGRGPYGRLRPLRNGREVPGIGLSLSRAGDWRALAISSAGPVGVDVEPVPDQALRPSGTWCTRDELRSLADLPDDALPRGTALLWTLKEAVLKALGTGLAVAPHRIGAAELHRFPVVHSVDGRPAAGWETAPVPVPDGYVGTVALRRRHR